MPRIDDYRCACGNVFEALKMSADDAVTCPSCGSLDIEVLMGAPAPFKVITPMHRTSLKNKAGFVHTHGDKPAEKTYVSVPRTTGE